MSDQIVWFLLGIQIMLGMVGFWIDQRLRDLDITLHRVGKKLENIETAIRESK